MQPDGGSKPALMQKTTLIFTTMKTTTMLDCILTLTAFGHNKDDAFDMVCGKDESGETHFDYVVRTYGNKSAKQICRILNRIDFTPYVH